MSATNRTDLACDVFKAFAAGDRERIESLLAPSLSFHSPPDPYLDRAGYFERCWPGSGSQSTFDFARIIEAGDEVVVTYDATRKDGSRFRKTEVLTFEGDQVAEIEVISVGTSRSGRGEWTLRRNLDGSPCERIASALAIALDETEQRLGVDRTAGLRQKRQCRCQAQAAPGRSSEWKRQAADVRCMRRPHQDRRPSDAAVSAACLPTGGA